MADLTPFERELCDLGVPLGTVFTLELRLGVREWDELATLAVLDLSGLPGLDVERASKLRREARLRVGLPADEGT